MTTKPQQNVTYLGKLKDLFVDRTEDGDMLLRLNAGTPGITYFARLDLSPEMSRLLSRAIADYVQEKPFPHELVIDLARVRYLNIIEEQIKPLSQGGGECKIRFELGGMANTFLGVEALTISVNYASLANLLPNYERTLMRERYKRLGKLRQWLWRWLLGKGAILGLPGVKF